MNGTTKRVLLSIAAALLLLSSNGFAQTQTHSAVPVDLEIPIAPTPVRADGKTHLVYELHITNFDKPSRDLTLTSLEVLGEATGETSLVRLSPDVGNPDPALRARLVGETLTKQISRPGAPKDLPDKRRIAGGMRAVVFSVDYCELRLRSPNLAPSANLRDRKNQRRENGRGSGGRSSSRKPDRHRSSVARRRLDGGQRPVESRGE